MFKIIGKYYLAMRKEYSVHNLTVISGDFIYTEFL